MLTTILLLALSIWPFAPARNHSRDWYARRLHHIQQQRANRVRQHSVRPPSGHQHPSLIRF